MTIKHLKKRCRGIAVGKLPVKGIWAHGDILSLTMDGFSKKA